MKTGTAPGRLESEDETILASYRAVLADHVPTSKRELVLPRDSHRQFGRAGTIALW